MIPDNLDGWSLQLVEALVAQGVFETDRFDFKEVLPDSRDNDAKQRLRHACAAFANSNGGFLVFGIKDGKGLAPAARIVGVPATDDLPAKFGNYPAAVQPSVQWTFKNPPIPLSTGKVVHVFYIAPSPRSPHAVAVGSDWQFRKRTNKGNEPMSLEEIRDAFRERVRGMRTVGFIRAEVERMVEVATGTTSGGGTLTDLAAVRYLPSTLDSAMPAVFDIIDEVPELVKHLNELRAIASSADAYYRSLDASGRNSSSRYAGIRQQTAEIQVRIKQAARKCLEALDRISQ